MYMYTCTTFKMNAVKQPFDKTDIPATYNCLLFSLSVSENLNLLFEIL